MQLKAKRLYQELANQIEADLAAGLLAKEGEKIPPERELSEKYSVSRTTVREALIMLELNGIVDVKKGSGVVFLGLQPEQEETLSITVGPFELLQARQWFESSIAELSAINMSNSQLRELKELIMLGPCGEDVDRKIHILIAEGTHNNMMIKAANDMWTARETAMWSKMFTRILDLESARRVWQQDHQNILHALMRRDAKGAREAMWTHLENVKNALFEASDVDDPNFDGYMFAQ